MLDTFIKTYSDRAYKHVTMVRHRGTVIALALDQERRIFYSVLDLKNADITSPLDVNFWFSNPQELFFPNEIAEVGVGVADQTMLPAVKKGSREPGPSGIKVRDDEKDFFLSSTARFTEDAPFQAMSDGRHVFVFRQAIAANHADNVIKLDVDGNEVKDADGNPVKLVDNTLLVDRFVLSGTELKTKMEVRFQRSRSKTRPQSRKDSLGAKDMDDNPFFEPTQELRFVSNLTAGRFTALLLPTQLPNVERWQIFAHNSKTGLLDSYNVQRSDDGLFNTRGTQEMTEHGHAESAVDFADGNAFVELSAGVDVGVKFTQEVWVFPRSSAPLTPDQAVMGDNDRAHDGSPSLRITQRRAIRAGFGDGNKWYEIVTGNLLQLDEWNHLAVVFDGTTYRVYLNGEESFRAKEAEVYLNGELQAEREALEGKVPANNGIRYFGAHASTGSFFRGIIDEIRLWNRSRSQGELKRDRHVRLTGFEPGLAGYWRFDEASGATIHDQTNNAMNGALSGGAWTWVTSEAPVGENAGLQRSSFKIAGRSVVSGLSALLYYHQESEAGANGGQTRPLKRSGRVMLAFATQASSANRNEITTLDFGVSNMGRLAQAPDNLQLEVIKPASSDGLTVGERLQRISELEQTLTTLNQDVINLTADIETLNQIDDILKAAITNQPASPVPDSADPDLKSRVNGKLQALKEARATVIVKKNEEQSLVNELSQAKARFYEHSSFRGRSVTGGRGYVGYTYFNQHGFNDIISSIRIPRALRVTVYQHANRGGRRKIFVGDTGYVGDDFNDIISSADVVENPAFAQLRSAATTARQNAESAVGQLIGELQTEQANLRTVRRAKEQERSAKQQQAISTATELQSHHGKLGEGVAVSMPMVHTDPFGLSLTGGALGFAWTNDTPLLFDSATGKLALYFRGADDQFFVCYYNTSTQRAQYNLLDERGNRSAVCLARSTEPEMDQLLIEVQASDDEETCTVRITGAGLEENWQHVPRAPERFARVLNGDANERAYIGSGVIETEQGRVERLNIAKGVRRSLEQGATLRAGNTKLRVREAVARGATILTVDSAATNPPTAELPLFYFEYDYAGQAQTTKVPGDLSNGSMLVWVASLRSAGRIQTDQETKSGSTLVSQWTAALPGHTLSFDGADDCAHLQDNGAANLKKFAAAGDVSLEAWVRPREMADEARVLLHHSAESSYTLGLKRQPLLSALQFDGTNDYVQITNIDHLNFTGAITIEAWIKPEAIDGSRHIVAHGYPHTGTGELFLRIEDNSYQIGIWSGQNYLAAIPIPAEDRNGLNWIHLAGVYDAQAKQWTLYRNGSAGATKNTDRGAFSITADWGIGGNANPDPATTDRRLFKGQIDEVRIWKRARTQAEIQADMNRQLSGNETDLAGYWHFEDRAAQDYSRYQNHGVVQGDPELATSPLPGYRAFAGVGEKFVQTRGVFAGGSWTHLAAVYNQSYAVELDGNNAYMDCGNDPTLDLSGDLTIEVFLQLRGRGSQGLVTKGKIDDGTEQDVPFSLHIDGNGRIVLAFEDTEHGNHEFASENFAVTQGYFNRIAVTRKRNVETRERRNNQGQVIGADVEKWYDLKFYSKDHTGKIVERASHKYEGPDVGSSNGPLEIGRAFLAGFREARCKGVISEVRIWSVPIPPADIGVDLKGTEKGLVSWWRFEENDGNVAFDSKSSNHAKFRGNVKWVKNPEFAASRLLLYRDGETVASDNKKVEDFHGAAADQFTLGALDNATRQDFFQGEMEEVRIWKIARTQEQVQDNIFRRLVGEKEDLIAYYTFDAESNNKLSDHSFRGNDLEVSGASHVISSAPVGEDTPQVRSALADIRTPFNGLLQGRPAVQEYGDMQYDIEGNLIGVLKRCYAFILHGQWHVVTGFKVGNLVTEWIGQVQFAPELKGFIEGAPPVPSENLTATDYVLGEFADYTGASAVEMVEADKTFFTYSATRDGGIDSSLDLKLGVLLGTKVEAGFGLIAETINIENVIGGHITYESYASWLAEARAGTGLATTKISKIELRGFVENVDDVAYPYPKVGRRFVPDNVGFALVQSETADVFALRLAHNNALISYQMRPNPDIPKDWNIISFPLNRFYTKQGTLDGKAGFDADPDYPNALNYSPDVSFFKPIEAYALKNRIQREEEAVRVFYEQFSKSALAFGAGNLLEKLPSVHKRNLVNTYVWTSDGGQFAETQETIEIQQESSGRAFGFKAMAGVYTDLKLRAGGVGFKFELDALIGGHLDLTVSKSEESEISFGVNVDLSGVERDIYLRTQAGELVMDLSDPKQPKPKLWPGKVNAYRFLTFYLEPKTDHFDTFFNKVVDPIWLEQSDDPNADALRQARQTGTKSECWRIFHRVTFVSRILPDLADTAAPPLERTLKELDIDSNYELIKLLEPFVADKLGNFAEFAQAIRDTLKTYHPELQAHSEAIIQYMSLYYGITEDARLQLGEGEFEDELLGDGVSPLPAVDAGPEYLVTPINTMLELQGVLINNRQPVENLLIVWNKVSGPGAAAFANPNALTTPAAFSERGLYVLRLSVNDGLLVFSDDIEVAVNRPPQVSAGDDREILPREAVELVGALLDSGLGDPQRGEVNVKWEQIDGPGTVTFEDDKALRTQATFSKSGSYLLRLTANNGSFEASDEMVISVAGRVTNSLQALYVFQEGQGNLVRDVSSINSPLPLTILDETKVQWIDAGLTITEPATLRTHDSVTRMVEAMQASNELTVEVWIKPASPSQPGLARIVTLSAGSQDRNFILGQRENRFYAAVRTNSTNNNASDKALAGGEVGAGVLMHVVCTRTASGSLRLFIDGNEVAQRKVAGTFVNWNKDFVLALGNELSVDSQLDRAWSGEFHLVALYARALTPAEVKQNFEFGADTNLPPLIFAGGDLVLNLPDRAMLEGKLLDDRLVKDQLQVSWAQASGPTSVEFENPTDVQTHAVFESSGKYVLRLTVSDGELSSSDELTVIVNQQPTIDAGSERNIALSNPAVLQGAITNNGLGDDAISPNLVIEWSKISGPGNANFANRHALDTQVSFTEYGAYVLQLSVDNGQLPPALAQVTIHVNQAPVIRATADPILILPGEATLAGEEVDLGMADPNGTVTRTWTKVSGPGEVTFADAHALTTTAQFSQGGVYVLQLTVETSGQGFHLSSAAEVTVIANRAPVVDAGQDQTITLPASAELEGTVSDDGLPDSPGVVTVKWEKVKGPGQVNFTSNRSPFTYARFSTGGEYVLRLSALDYAEAAPVSDVVTITVIQPPRVTDGLLALYTFAEGKGETIHDVSGIGEPLDLKLEKLQAKREVMTWLDKGLRINKPLILKATGKASKLLEALQASNAITIEAWIKPAEKVARNQSPGAILTFSADTQNRNFTLGQTHDDNFEARLRTTKTDDNGTERAPLLAVRQELCHVVYTRASSDKVQFYLNGTDPSGSRHSVRGRFANWNDMYQFALANELTGDRPWLGEVHLIAIYNRALSESEVQQNFMAKP